MLLDRESSTATHLALTFDDGPDPRGTPEILDALRRHDIRATFFVIAPAAQRHPGLIAQIAEAGHTIGLHCDEHIRHTEMTRTQARADTERALQRLEALGITPDLWRTPWGVRSAWTDDLAAECGLQVVGWDIDTHDWRGDSAVEMFARTRDRLSGRVTVLAHDGIGPGARRDDCRETAAYVELVVAHSVDCALELIAL